jgi:hypothetical protein
VRPLLDRRQGAPRSKRASRFASLVVVLCESQAKLIPMPLATKELKLLLEKFKQESLQDFQSGCVGSMHAEELKDVVLKLEQGISDRRESVLAKNSELLRQQAADVKDQCVQQAKVCDV